MSKKKKKDRLKLPKRILGAKVPKDARKRINAILQLAPAGQAKPVVAGAVTMVATLLAERLEGPLNELLQRYHLGDDKSGGDKASHAASLAKH